MQEDATNHKDNITAAAPETEKKSVGVGVAAMVIGIASILFFCLPVVGQIISVLAIVLGIVAIAGNRGKSQGILGLVFGIISLLISVLFIILISVTGSDKFTEEYFKGTAWRRLTDGSVTYFYPNGTFICVEDENNFTDNFFTGTYDVVSYKNSGTNIGEYEKNYDMDYGYDIFLHVDMYVKDGGERENIAETIRYLYILDKGYKKGDEALLSAHEGTNYSAVIPIKETDLAMPSGNNAYVPSEDSTQVVLADNEVGFWGELLHYAKKSDDQEELPFSSEDLSTIADTEQTTQVANSSENTSEQTEATETTDATEATENTAEAASATEGKPVTDSGDTTDNTKPDKTENVTESDNTAFDLEGFSEHVEQMNSEFADASSRIEEASSQIDEMSSHIEESASSIEETQNQVEDMVEDVENQIDQSAIEAFIDRILDFFRDFLNLLGF